MTYPIKLKEYLYGEKFWETDFPEQIMEDHGVPEELLKSIRCLVYELELDLELHEDGSIHITHVAGQKLDSPIVNT
jgi:hypothetical protein